MIFVEHATVMDHKYKALLQNIPTRHVITAIAKPADRPQQIAKLRNLDINNFFILGSLQLIREVLGEWVAKSNFSIRFWCCSCFRVSQYRLIKGRIFRTEFRMACNHTVFGWIDLQLQKCNNHLSQTGTRSNGKRSSWING